MTVASRIVMLAVITAVTIFDVEQEVLEGVVVERVVRPWTVPSLTCMQCRTWILIAMSRTYF